jgi:hypothetical protein
MMMQLPPLIFCWEAGLGWTGPASPAELSSTCSASGRSPKSMDIGLSVRRPRTNFSRDRQCSVRSAVIPVMESPVLLLLGRDQEHNQYPHERSDEDS